ncbi:flagellar hook-basal body complex protein [Aliarcobacter cryaerophilus]|uniref:Flagellar hook protein FlgE n=3 Tax=unclassified Arcobacter TaxID=2593671 RepID=A0AA96L6W2_9BACT|nr:flagellar hook-basal body complex protein [Aliarcobacter cryaerophilus]WNL28657.1 flagellar hook-basal body complex protein [Arcobacter sp. AZ-2023]WPD06249.1 flagellar hook-basal body complex protein [Arcobacter sp. DSM 115956]WPD08340.1 flagellar hook-basal body complex protein [Arcobacter sp. DSM 115955]MCT7502160.1 flagellar hook-basal body complex protein [Aliarcobacter cryaerophilus]WNL32605.1 flagellar hook-basal body complex protein [Arcobacter sp. AZ-2023]
MIGALWTGISGLAAHQTALDNESNNIANVNTVGYKAGRISFADQIYQGKIGKGSFVQDAEKIFVTGGSKITGVEYDVALQGDGFFTVINKNTLGTAETFYTRAGNFRMGQSGTLQNPDGYEVQGWAMSSIDQKNDVVSTNSNASRFTDAYIKTLGSSIIRHGDFIETIAAKATNFDETAKSDSTTVFSGAGAKTKAAKLKDIALAMEDYNTWLQKYKDDPTLPSAGSTAQVSQANFRTGVPPTSIIGKEGDSIEIVINGNQYTQNFVPTKTTPDYRQELWNSLPTVPVDERALYSLMDPVAVEAMPTVTEADRAAKDAQVAKYDRLAGKIETYKAMADKISNKEAGLVAYMAKDRINPTADILDPNGMYEASTNLADMLRGVIQIKSLVPGKEFKITQVAEYSGENKNFSVKGSFQTTAVAVAGSGKAALEASREALSRLVSGSQQSVYTTQDLYGAGNTRVFSFSIEIFDKDLGMVIPVPNDGGTPPQPMPIPNNAVPPGVITGNNIDDIINAINNSRTASGPQLGDYLVAKNVNGNLVIETNDSNYDVEFDAKLTYDEYDPADPSVPPTAPTLPLVADNALVEVNPNYSGRKGAGGEFMEITTRVDQTSTQSSLQLRLDVLNISDSKFGQFNIDDTGLVTIKEGGVEYAVGQVSIARFTNNRGLEAVGNNNFQRTQESGNAIYSINNNNTSGVKGQALELSKADLSESLVNLMVFQRAFEANAKSITTSDELLSTLINLKR